jgi:hypothetical protein
VTDLAAHGIEVTLPAGWEGRVFKRPSAGEVSAFAADGPPAPEGETTHAVLHAATIALPIGIGDFASGAVDQLGTDDLIVVLFEYDAASVDTPLFQHAGIPRQLQADDFSPNVMQRAIRGQAGVQRFFNDQGRAFCLYVVIGSFARRAELVKRVNAVLSTLTIGPVDATPSTSTTAPPSSTAAPTTDAPSTTVAPTTDGSGSGDSSTTSTTAPSTGTGTP